jgi:prepilin-type N-terminal cleavage/methylation domain-containing protein
VTTHPAPGSESGFTLLEVLIAMIILATGVVGLQALGVTAIRANAEAGRQTTTTSWMNGSLEEALFAVRFASDPTQVATGTSCEEGELGRLCTTVTREVTEPAYHVFSVEVVFEPAFRSAFGLDQPTSVTSTAYVPVPPPPPGA